MKTISILAFLVCVGTSSFRKIKNDTKSSHAIVTQHVSVVFNPALFTKEAYALYYQWILHNDGCFYLHRIYDFGEVTIRQEVMPWEYCCSTVDCQYYYEIDDMC